MASVTFRVTRTGNVFGNSARAMSVMENALSKTVAPQVKRGFEARVANWKHQPKFTNRTTKTPDAITATIWPTKSAATMIFGYVSMGTKPHKIRAKNAPTLAFMWGGPGSYQPKTTAGGGFGGPGSVVGGKMHFPKEVNHPGNAPRDIPEKVLKKEEAWIKAQLAAAWKRAISAMETA